MSTFGLFLTHFHAMKALSAATTSIVIILSAITTDERPSFTRSSPLFDGENVADPRNNKWFHLWIAVFLVQC